MTHNVSTETESQFKPMTFTVTDPRTFDGDPYEVAERALKQAAGVAAVLEKMLDAADRMACNAEMERAFAAHEDPQGSEWRNTPQGARMARIAKDVGNVRKGLNVMAQAAGYNPKKPPRG